jgi:hypothetical protein
MVKGGSPPGPKDQLAIAARARRHTAMQMLATGMPRAAILAQLEKQYQCTPGQARTALAKVQRMRRVQYEQEQPYLKAQQLARLEWFIREAANSAKKKDAGWGGVAALEDKYARIVGNYEPVRVQVDPGAALSDAIGRWLGQLTPEERSRIELEQAQVEALADAAKASGVVPGSQLNGHGANGAHKPS